ncbi:hypothetical protein [Thermococcus chitonophagus]|nr:hypothetical protein [Thermococcus chitonophagus]
MKMEVTTAITTMQNLAKDYPYLALGIVLLFVALFIRGKMRAVIALLGLTSFLYQFGLVDPFVDLVKTILHSLPSILEKIGGVLG